MSVVALHRDRRATIGGSDAAAAAGIDPHRSKVMLWLEKTGRYTRPETEAMRWGRLIEPAIFQALELDGYAPSPSPGLLVDSEREWLTGTPDGFAEVIAGPAVLEVKTTNGWAHRAADGVPLQHVAQVQHYLHLTGLQRALLAVLVNGQHLEVHEIARNDAAIAMLLDAEERMHWHVVTDTQPAIGGSDSDREALTALYPHAAPERKVRLDADAMRDIHELRARKEQAKAVDVQVQLLENRIKAVMGDAELAVSPHDDEVARWTNVETKRIDTTRLKAEAPSIAEQYLTATTSRRFSVL